MQGCRHQPAELDLCDFLQNGKENKAYSDKYANFNFKAFIKIIMKTKIQSCWEEPKEKEKKKKRRLTPVQHPLAQVWTQTSAQVMWQRFTAATTLNLNCCSYNGFSESGYHYIIVFITIIVIFHHFVFAQKKEKKQKNKTNNTFFRSWSPPPNPPKNPPLQLQFAQNTFKSM